MLIDPIYCACSFFQFRMIENENYSFSLHFTPRRFTIPSNRTIVTNWINLKSSLQTSINSALSSGKCALMLSSGIDSAILAKLLPKGTKAYTLKCNASGAIDETIQAKRYAEICGLDHEIINISWDDYIKFTPLLLRHMGQPIHSIEPQIYKAALKAKSDKIENLIFGETADIIYGGHSIQLCKEFQLDEYIDYHNFVDPRKALKNGYIIKEPYERHYINGRMDVYGFLNDIHLRQSPNSYINSCSLAGVNFVAPYLNTKLGVPLDLNRIRSGENKYIVRELFHNLYPNMGQPKKLPLPRALDIWMKNYEGAKRKEFNFGYGKGLTPDQKWYVYIVETFMNICNNI